MSAATSLAAGPAPFPETIASAPKRPTGAGLMRRLLSAPENARRLRDAELVPIGGALVLRAVARLVATSDGSEFYPVHPVLNPGGLARSVAIEMRVSGAEGQIAALLGKLHDAALIALDDDGVSLVLPEAVAPDRVGGSAPQGRPTSRIGRKRASETEAQFAARLASAREMVAQWSSEQTLRGGQPSFKLSLAGGRGGEAGLPRDISADMCRDISADMCRDISAPDIDGGSPADIAGFSTPISAARPADAAASQTVDILDMSAKSAASARRASGDIDADICPDDICPADISAGDISPPDIAGADIASATRSGGTADSAQPSGAAVDVSDLATKILADFGLRPDKRDGVVWLVRAWLDAGVAAGLTRDEARGVVATQCDRMLQRHVQEKARGLKGIRSANYLQDGVMDGMAEAADRKLLPPPAVRAAPSPSRVRARGFDALRRRMLDRLHEGLVDPPPEARFAAG